MDAQPTLYRHSKRKQWGLGILAWEGPTRRRYQFQDGELRTFKKGYYHLLEEVSDQPDNAEEIVNELMAGLERSEARVAEQLRRSTSGPRETVTVTHTHQDQVEAFLRAYPGGFEDEAWKKDVRGLGKSRRVKAHREPVLIEAGELLPKGRLEDRLSNGEHEAALQDLTKIMRKCDFYQVKNDIRPIEELEGEDAVELMTSLNALLHGPDPDNVRVDRFVATLNGLAIRPTWSLVTGLLAMAHPQEHFPVKPTVTRKLAKRMSPHLKLGNAPSGRSYVDARDMAKTAKRQLEASGQNARDLVDIHDYLVVSFKEL